MKKSLLLPLVFCALTGSVLSQIGPTPTARFDAPGTQGNSPSASLDAAGTITVGNATPTAVTILTPASPVSATQCFETQASVPTGPGGWNLTGALRGAPGSPVILALDVEPGSLMCGGFAGWPCMTGPLVLANTLTPAGLLHLRPASLVFVIDGVGGQAPPASLDASGQLLLSGTGTISTSINGGQEMHIAVQGAVVDPSSPVGLRLTASFTLAHWSFYL